MPEGMEDFEDLFLAFVKTENEKTTKIYEKTKVIYNEIFGKMSLLDKINKFIQIKPWLNDIKDYFDNNPSVITALGINDVYDLRRYINPIFIDELAHLYEFTELNFDNYSLSDDEIKLWNKSTMFWFTTKLWLVTIGDTDCIVQKIAGQDKIFYFLSPLDEFIITNRYAKENLSEDELNKFAKQFTEFTLSHKK